MRRLIYELTESVRIAAAQIRANKLRSALTALGVIIGIVAVTLMGTAIKGIDAGVDRSMSGFGDDILYVSKWPWSNVDDWWNYRNRKPIRHTYAAQVNEWVATTPGSALRLAVPTAERMTTIIRGEYRLNNIYTLGTTADYSRITRSDLNEGRFFTDFEGQAGSNVCVIGFDVADALFPNESPLGKTIRIRDQNFQVIGVAAKQGSFLGLWSWDSMVAMPLTTFRRYYRVGEGGEIRVQVDNTRMAEAKEELQGLMRRLRGLGPEQRDDFNINEQGTIREQLDPIKNGIAMAGLFITGLALFVGAIGIMNITYVSVKERTKEIGTRKALGARRRTILLQFLVEAVAICFVGGVAGLALAAGLTSLVGIVAPSFPLVFSTSLVVIGLTVSVLTGIFSGFAPAWAASKLDPVVALRYE
ncbi:Macrolide export ATP-binding/permease protein MacB [Lacunisphaera limnophila]|uniref:Macrolide export ATP-binding/permease protein MacB n=1 Tax=Lacunisphaera limnophila TaxID=1838286 RepID=A0A1D8AVW2_9BACT|nr:ABC transporter permease [Lacunisphaera limnophila]AOS45034.1 Macrolide export ATP-binding/permease protein MacB [Lacunisphaera limnophila]